MHFVDFFKATSSEVYNDPMHLRAQNKFAGTFSASCEGVVEGEKEIGGKSTGKHFQFPMSQL